MEENKYFRPFGPSIGKFTLPDNIIKILNNHADEIIKDNDKLKNLDHGKRLAGNVTQEFKLEPEFLKRSGFLDFLALCTTKWIKATENKKITKFNVSSSWIVRQFENEYNPLHY